MNRIRRHTLAALAALACTALSVLGTGALAQPAYPAKPVTLVNNFPPGGPADILARSVGAVLQETLKQPFVVDRPRTSDPAPGSVSANAAWMSPRHKPGSSRALLSSDAPVTMARQDRSAPVMSEADALRIGNSTA